MSHRRRAAHLYGAFVAAVAVVALAAAGCGSSGSDNSSTSSGSSTTAGSDNAGIAHAKAELAQYTRVPTFRAPGPPVDASKVKGKLIFNIPNSSAIPFVQTIDQQEAAAAKLVGARFTEYTNQGTPAEWARGFQTAIANHADVITTSAVPSAVIPQVALAKRAGIPVISTHNFDAGAPVPPPWAAAVPTDFTTAGNLMADWTIQDSNAKANILLITSNDVFLAKEHLASLLGHFKQYCGSGCNVKVVNVPSTEWAQKLQTTVQSSLLANPDIDYVLPMYDSMSQFVIPAITAAHRTGQIKIATFNGTPFALKDLQDGNAIQMDVGESLQWDGWANIDQAMRLINGMPPVKDEFTALRAFTRDNIDEAGTPPQVDKGFGDSYISGYKKLWGLG